ncbi:MAG: NlpC/P60 family protein [Chitinophagales bacterium]
MAKPSNPQFGIVHLAVIPMRAEASDKSEMVNQLLFGETFEVLKQDRQWAQIQTTFDQYEGWIDEKQFLPLSQKEHQNLQNKSPIHTLETMHPILHISEYFPILMGSRLPHFNGRKAQLANKVYTYLGETTYKMGKDKASPQQIIGFAFNYLHAPYLWGGRSPFGIDCSGLTQLAFKLGNIALPRDAYQQAEIGETIGDFAAIKAGDLAYFNNDDGKIIHVGIVLNNKGIIHASGKVRVDKLHEPGIFNVDTKKYSHKLAVVKRCL